MKDTMFSTKLELLTPIKWEIIKLWLQGNDFVQIAKLLDIQEDSVVNHFLQLYCIFEIQGNGPERKKLHALLIQHQELLNKYMYRQQSLSLMSEPKQQALILEPFHEEGIKMLSPYVDCEVRLNISREELLTIVSSFDILIVRSQIYLDREVLEAATNLKVLAVACVGYENVDVQAAIENGIKVVNAPNLNSEATADFAFTLVLILSLQIFDAHRMIMDGRWERNKIMAKKRQPSELVLGVVGCGSVGLKVCRKAINFGVGTVLACSKHLRPEEANALGITLVNLEDLMARSDVVTLHPRPDRSSVGMIDYKLLSLMQPSAFIVNTARSSLINTGDLLEALRAKIIAGAALDVFDEEPLRETPLRELNVLFTSHLAGCGETVSRNISIEVANNILGILSGSPARNLVMS